MMISDVDDNKAFYKDVFTEFHDSRKQISITRIGGANGKPDLLSFTVLHNHIINLSNHSIMLNATHKGSYFSQ